MPNKIPQPACPECEKLFAVAEESNKIGDFLSWLTQTGHTICTWDESYGGYCRDYISINHLLGEYFEIDMDKVEKERMAILKWLQEQHNDN